jgi:dephospho-CoA kinase
VGLTGGIASGKSTVAELLISRGYPVVDADLIARQVVEKGQPALAKLASTFGPGILDEAGELDRRALGRIVFDDVAARKRLEGITHPAIANGSAQQFTEHRAAGHKVAFYNAALLVETGSWRGMSALVVVSAPPEVQVARILARDPDLEESDAHNRIASQMSLSDKEEKADFIIINDAGLETLESRLDDTVIKLLTHLGINGAPNDG